jgi:hypothetical protein
MLEQEKTLKPIFSFIILIVIIVAGVFAFKYYKKPGQPASPESKPKIQISRDTLYDPAKGTPPGFPAGLPLDKPLNVVSDSSHTITVEGKITTESTFEYITAQDMKTNSDKYRSYLIKQGWKIVTDTSFQKNYSISATHLQETFLYIYSHNTVDQKNYVKLIYSKPELTQAEKDFINQLQSIKK